MVAQSLLDSVLALPAEDRLDLFVKLQDNLRADPSATPLSDAHRRILDERLADLDRDPSGGSDWQDVIQRARIGSGRA